MAAMRFYSIIILSSLFLHLGISQTQQPDRYVFTQWGMNNGLPQSSVNDIIQTRDGYLWIATFGGLVRFNGQTFTTFNRSNSKGLQSDRILMLYEDHSGAIWCSTEDGLVRYDHGSFRSFQYLNSAYNYSPLMIAEDTHGLLWVSVDAKPYRFADSVFIPVPVITDPAFAARALKDTSGVWIAHGTELLRSMDTSIVLIKNFSELRKNNIQHVEQDPANPKRVLLATSGSGMFSYDIITGAFRIFTTQDGLASNFLRRIYIDHARTVWALGFNGISRLDGEKFVPLRTVNGNADHEFNVMTEDAEGNYWVGTPSQGLFRLRSSIITMIDEKNGLHEGKMLSLLRRKNGSFLFGTNCGGIYEYSNNKAVYSPLNALLPNLCVWSLFEDSKGRIWAGSRVLTCFDRSGTKRTVYDSTSGFYGLDVFATMEDSKGTIWIGCLNGLFAYDGNHFHQYTTADGLTHNNVRALFEDASGTLWIGTTNGLNKFENGSVVPVPLMHTGGDSSEAFNPYVRAIFQDSDGILWFGTYGDGIIRLKNGKFSVITTHHGLPDNTISHIWECEQGYFWMGNNRGIVRVSRDELQNAADGKIPSVNAYLYGEQDGMKSPETNGGFQPSIAVDDDGNIFFPTVNGVAVVATRKMKRNYISPPVKIENIFNRDHEMHPENTVTIPYDSADFEIHYASLSYDDQSKIRYKYKLADLEQKWIDVGTRNKAYYNNIPPGEWTFHVIASNNDGVWNEQGASIHITVTPPFWMSWWFRIVVILFFISTGPSIYFYRVTQLKKEKKQQQQFAAQLIDSQEQERRRIASELHDGLGQQILIIKNRAEMAMKHIGDSEKMREQLHEITQSANSSMEDVRSISHGLRPIHLEQFGLHDTLENLCEQVKSSSSIAWSYYIDAIDGIIPTEKEINFYRIMQEGINNILRHSAATQATVMIRNSGTELTASLWDNGKGFDTTEGANRAGLGLTGIRERVNTFWGECIIHSEPGQGTTLTITIPIQRNG